MKNKTIILLLFSLLVVGTHAQCAFTVSAAAYPPVICSNLGQTSATLTATGSNTITYNWLPSGSSGQLLTVTPTVTTTYTLAANVGGWNGCFVTQTVTVFVSTVCCSSAVTPLNSSIVSGQAINGPKVINQDLTITGNAISMFENGEFLIAPNVKITIQGGSQLELNGAHLYGCSTTMWQGIDVLMNGRILAKPSSTTGNCTLLEDAITAVNLNNFNSVPAIIPIELFESIFNKNYVNVKITNATNNSIPISVLSMVFTCRTFTFNQTQWPNASITGSGLRVATNPTTGLASPYGLQGASYTNLKSPYSNQPSQIGFFLTSVGNQSGVPIYSLSIGRQPLGASDAFNLFDGLQYGIFALNSNVHISNNVFQNMRRFLSGFTLTSYPGTGIFTRCNNTTMFTELKLTEPNGNNSFSTGNRFWNCFYGICAEDLTNLDVQFATFRSSQTTTNTGIGPGYCGITAGTRSFNYNISGNVFNNIRYGVNISPWAGTYGNPSQYGVLATNMFINNNYFGAQTSSSITAGTAFMNTAIYLGGNNAYSWVFQGAGAQINSNNINRVWNGISVGGLNNLPTSINTNSITMVDDPFSLVQHGIELINVMNNKTVLTNTISGSGITNTSRSLFYSSANVGLGSPSVCCNRLDNSYKAFEFLGNNIGSAWKGNVMDTHARGLMLSANGQIGQQGSSLNPTDNQWINFGSNNGTWTDATSDAQYSKLFINTGGTFNTPPNNSGIFTGMSYAASGNIVSTTGAYTCAGSGTLPPVYITVPQYNASNTSAEMRYSADHVLYSYLDLNSDTRNADANLLNFYNGFSGSSHDLFSQVELKFSQGQIGSGLSLNSSVTATNTVETNFKNFYTLYGKYANGTFSSSDSSSLYGLAGLCPGTNGPCVYHATSLYNRIYKTVLRLPETCNDGSGGRQMATAIQSQTASNKNLIIELFPNPATNLLQLRSNNEKEGLSLCFTDVYGRKVFEDDVICDNFISTLGLNLANGLYLVRITNSNNESITKKLVISK
jgi:hypothetical protein